MKERADQPQSSAVFADAVAVWHMSDLGDSAGESPLTVHGDVKLGVELGGAERDASLKRGGDGYVAEFHGGYVIAGQDADPELSLTGKEMTVCIRLQNPSGDWNSPLFGRYDGNDPLSNILYSVNVDTKPFLLKSPFYLFAEEGRGSSRDLLEFRWRTKPLNYIIDRFKGRPEGEDPIADDARVTGYSRFACRWN